MNANDKPHSGSDLEQVEALLGACLAEGEARLEDLVERLCGLHADRAPAIREEAEAAPSAGMRRQPKEHAGLSRSAYGAPFERIGAYPPLREPGRGGQGFVYLAEDTRLHRVVALGSPGRGAYTLARDLRRGG